MSNKKDLSGQHFGRLNEGHELSPRHRLRRRKKERTKKMTSEANKRANAKYKREKTKAYTFRFSVSTDKRVINRIESAPNKRGYIRNLILDDIAKEGKQ